MSKIPLISFTLCGPMAHFRKFYASTSALTYPFPPRTVLMGLIAGLLGENKDSYYDSFNSEKLWIGVRMCSPVRICTYTVNYLFTKNNKLYDKGRGTQIPIGWVLPRPPDKILRYRVYVSSPESDLWDNLEDIFSHNRFCWPPYLGLTEALAWIEDVWIGEVVYKTYEEAVLLGTPVLRYPDIELVFTDNGPIRLALDRFTLNLSLEPYRSPKKTVSVLYETEGRPFKARLSMPVFPLPDMDKQVFGTFFRELK